MISFYGGKEILSVLIIPGIPFEWFSIVTMSPVPCARSHIKASISNVDLDTKSTEMLYSFFTKEVDIKQRSRGNLTCFMTRVQFRLFFTMTFVTFFLRKSQTIRSPIGWVDGQTNKQIKCLSFLKHRGKLQPMEPLMVSDMPFSASSVVSQN